MYNYLYQITNLINNKIYIGVHTTSDLNDGYMGSGTAIKKAIRKYGIENFRKDILNFFETAEEALLAEESVVDSKFILREDTYNIRCGGIGGFEHINCKDKEDRVNIKALRQKIKSGEIKVGGSGRWTDAGREKVVSIARKNQKMATILANTDESKKKRKQTFSDISHSKGKNNSQYGKFWISNIETKEVRRITDNNIPDGWVRGKKGKQVKACWVNDGINERIINITELDTYLRDNYNKGRINRESLFRTL